MLIPHQLYIRNYKLKLNFHSLKTVSGLNTCVTDNAGIFGVITITLTISGKRTSCDGIFISGACDVI